MIVMASSPSLSTASRIIVPIVIVLAGALLGTYLVMSRPEARPNPPGETVHPVRVIEATYERVQPELLVYGEIVAGREAEIRAMVAGRIVELDPAYRSGAFVEAGQPFLTIDPFDYDVAVRERLADVDEARARLAELEAEIASERRLLVLLDDQIALRERDRDRVRNLVLKKQTSEKSLDDAELTLNAAAQQRVQGAQSLAVLEQRLAQQRAALDRALAQLDRAERDLADTVVSAPFAGYLQDVTIATGKRLAVGESVGRLIDSDSLEVRFELPNASYARLVAAATRSASPGRHPLSDTKVTVAWRLGGGAYEYTGYIDRAGAEVDSTSGGVELFARITEGPVAILRPGAFVDVAIPGVVYDDVIVLPETAVSDDAVVYVVENSRLVQRNVDIVRESGDEVFVRGDIEPRAAIVAEQFPAIGPGLSVDPR